MSRCGRRFRHPLEGGFTILLVKRVNLRVNEPNPARFARLYAGRCAERCFTLSGF